MQIVTDSGTDIYLSPEEQQELNIHVIPLNVSLDNVTYREGVDIQPADFYPLLADTEDMPTTSQPSAGEFADAYRKILEYDQDILSVHISSGLSGTYNSAVAASQMLPDANITVIDTKTLSVTAGWQVEAAARAIKKGWAVDKVKSLLENVSAASDSLYTLNELKYLIHGGRISHMKGLVASILNIKPLIGVEKEGGTYVQIGQYRTFKRAVQGFVSVISEKHPPGSALRVQVRHSFNFDGAEMLKNLIDETFDCTWLPEGHISLVLGAHTGPSMIGAAYARQEEFFDL